MDLLLEFTLARHPLSLQTKNRPALAAYKAELAAAAGISLIRAAAPGESVFFSIGDFAWTGNQADADNIIKPAQDALAGVAYANDRQVRDALGFNRQMLGFVPLSPLPALTAALGGADEFIHVAVSAAADPHFEGVIDA